MKFRLSLESLEDRTLPTATPLGPDIPVNVHKPNDQYEAVVAMANNGGFVVAFTSHDNRSPNESDVFIRRFDSRGRPLGHEVCVNQTRLRRQFNPAIAARPNGDFVVVWQGDSADHDGAFDVFARCFRHNGKAVGGEFRVNDDTTAGQYDPAVAIDRRGDFVVTWTDDAPGPDRSSSEIMAKLYGPHGQVIKDDFQVNTFTKGWQSHPSVAMNVAGDFMVAWQSEFWEGFGHSFGIVTRKFDRTGQPLSDDIAVHAPSPANDVLPDIAMDNAGNGVVVWEESDGSTPYVFAQRFDAQLHGKGGPFLVNVTTQGRIDAPSVAMDTGGGFVVAWREAFTHPLPLTRVRAFGKNGQPLTRELVVNRGPNNLGDTDSASPDVDMNGAGDFVVAWHRGAGVNRVDVFARLFHEARRR